MGIFARENEVHLYELRKALGVPGFDRNKTVRILELEGLCYRHDDNVDPLPFVLYRREPQPRNGKTIFNRINFLWVAPVMLLVMPVKWLITGESGFSKNSRFGKILLKLIGE